MVRHGAGEESFACAWGTVEKYAFWLGDAEGFEEFRVFEAELDDFFDFFDLLRQTADHVVGAVWDFFDHHEGDERVDGGGERFLEFVAVGEEGDAFADGEFGDVDCVGDVDDLGGGECFSCALRGIDGGKGGIPYLPSGCTFTRTFFVPITLTTSPT